jgi:hypothetical protein
MDNNKIIPFMKLTEVYDNVQRDESGKLVGDCKVCGEKRAQALSHRCFKEMYKKLRNKE